MTEAKIIDKLYQNASIFLNDAILHLNRGVDSYSDMLLAVVDIQMSLELAIKVRIAQDYGIAAILEKADAGTSMEDLMQKYEMNSLRVKEFESVKNFLKSKQSYNEIFSSEYSYMERFQKYRNRLVHFDYNFSDLERVEMEKDIIHIIVYILHALLSSDISAEEYREFIFENIRSSEYEKLLQNHQFQTELRKVIIREYGDSYLCPVCFKKLLTPMKKCLGCLLDFRDQTAFGFVRCNYCGRKTVIFDALNLPDNKMIRGLCVNCEEDTVVYMCELCGNVYNLEAFDPNECNPDYCAVYHEPIRSPRGSTGKIQE